ncbi:MAG TPA: TonB-dependent receptor [Steroidobacteraceae bacterium]|nr:TonB-dependent receptor [Steroidobacteraceae bacterium]
MTRSRLNTARREGLDATRTRGRHVLRHAPLASAISAILAGVPAAQAQQAQPAGALEEVVVTAQKRSENLQDVPVAIIALGTEKLEELHITNLDDYVKYLPSVSYVRGQGQGGNGQPGETHIYMRGVVSGGDGNHSGSQPSVGTYLDEQPVTTIDGTVDVHIYDIARVEVLEGPQGTLYGASSQSGTIRIITNKPDPTKFEAGYDLGVNSVDHGGVGWEAEGFVNLPLSPIAAIRLVAFDEHDAGYISNVAGTNAAAGIINGVRTFPTWNADNGGLGTIGAGAISNAANVASDYNTVDVKGGRAALKLNLGDNWTVTPTFMGQSVTTEGFFGYDPVVGDLELAHFGPESSEDNWGQAALTVEGKVSNFDIVYAGAFMKRTTHTVADYSDYSYFYDKVYGSGAFWVGSNGQTIMPQELVLSHGYFQKFSHELRVSTPKDLPVKATVGLFVERQLHDIWEQYQMPGYEGIPFQDNPNGFADSLSIPGLPNTIWLTDEQRVDRDRAAFAQVTWDIDPQWSVSVGERYFVSDNTLQGFYGYSTAYLPSYGQGNCFEPTISIGSPCTDLDKRVTAKGHVPRYNLTYKIDPDKLLYATYSKGFRPGGVNRTSDPTIGPYQPDFLTNYEMGWKTQWLGHRLRWNGSLFWEDWQNFQFSFLGPHSVTIIENGGNARIKGLESELQWSATNNLLLSTSFTLLDPVLLQNYCNATDPVTGQAITSNPCPPSAGLGRPTPYAPIAPAGTNLPVTPKFKANAVARYTFAEMDGWQPNVQASLIYQDKTAPQLQVVNTEVVGMQPAYALFDLSAGMEKSGSLWQLVVTNVADRRAELTRFVQCTVVTGAGVPVCAQPYIIPAQPRTIALKFGQKF